MYRCRCALLVILLLTGVAAYAQKAEVSLTLGAAVSPDGKQPLSCSNAITCTIPQGTSNTISIGTGFAWQASLAYQLANLKAAAVYVEIPFANAPSRTGTSFSRNFSSVFFTPSAHVKFLPGRSVSPFASVGGGVAHISSLDSRGNAGALQLGGGVDFRTPIRAIGLRAEVRDFILGHASVSPLGDFSSHVQNIFAGGGIVLKF